MVLVAIPSSGDGTDTASDVRRNREKLSFVGGVSKTVDDTGKEERESVKGDKNSGVHDGEEVGLVILESLPDKAFVDVRSKTRVITAETFNDVCTLIFSQEPGSSRILVATKLFSVSDSKPIAVGDLRLA